MRKKINNDDDDDKKQNEAKKKKIFFFVVDVNFERIIDLNKFTYYFHLLFFYLKCGGLNYRI